MVDSPNSSQGEARQQWMVASIPMLLDGTIKRLDLTGANPTVKGGILTGFGVDLGELLAKGVLVESIEVDDGVEKGGVNYEYFNTEVPGIRVEMKFTTVLEYIDREPSAVSLVWNI